MLLVDTTEGRILEDEEVKRDIATRWPYRSWLERNVFTFDDLPAVARARRGSTGEELWRLQRAFGYTDEDVRLARCAHGRDGQGAHGLHGHGHAARGAERPGPAPSSTTSTSSSRR